MRKSCQNRGNEAEVDIGAKSGSIITSNMNKLVELQKTGRKVFTAQDLGVLWNYKNSRKLYELIKYYVNNKQIYRLAKGLYGLDEYDEESLRLDGNLLFEIANKLIRNSYISLFSALKFYGVIFQYYGEIYSVSSKPTVKMVKGVKFVYKKIKDDVLFNEMGIGKKEVFRMASIERAVCDSLYFFPKLGLEYVEGVNKEKIMKMAKIYSNQELIKRVKKLMEK